ncbi:MAG TPA: rod shape-determining protein MreC, partial [Myxococcota bacterium]|nr:rod shape-determining protein MreC [Myxococcota bacterium]
MVTSGDGGLFPPGLVVGTVAISDSGTVRVQPLVDFDRLEFVSVLQFDASRINTDDAQVRP